MTPSINVSCFSPAVFTVYQRVLATNEAHQGQGGFPRNTEDVYILIIITFVNIFILNATFSFSYLHKKMKDKLQSLVISPTEA